MVLFPSPPFFFFSFTHRNQLLGWAFVFVLNLQLSQGQRHIGQQPRPAGQALVSGHNDKEAADSAAKV